VTQSAVHQWIAGGRVRAEQVLDVAAAAGWRVTPHELRPDLYPHPDDGMPKTAELPLPATATG
jgi:DNA-binding transcriptional regulator YdaS (Cro superfamily)